MTFHFIIQQTFFIFRFRWYKKVISFKNTLWLKTLGMKIGSRTLITKIHITWPNQVSIGNDCQLEHNISFKYDGIWNKGPSIIIKDNVFIGSSCEFNCNCSIQIGKYSNIASGCRFIDHDHGIIAGERIGAQASTRKEIILGEDVWLGCNVIILKGVSIGNGAVVAAGAVVTKSIPANEIWGGAPAKFIRIRK